MRPRSMRGKVSAAGRGVQAYMCVHVPVRECVCVPDCCLGGVVDLILRCRLVSRNTHGLEKTEQKASVRSV